MGRTHGNASYIVRTPYALPTIRYRPLTGSGGVDRQITPALRKSCGRRQEWSDIEAEHCHCPIAVLRRAMSRSVPYAARCDGNVLVVVTDRHASPRREEIEFKRAKHDVAFHTDTIQSENQRVCAYYRTFDLPLPGKPVPMVIPTARRPYSVDATHPDC